MYVVTFRGRETDSLITRLTQIAVSGISDWLVNSLDDTVIGFRFPVREEIFLCTMSVAVGASPPNVGPWD